MATIDLLNCTYAGATPGALSVIVPETQPGFLGVFGTNCAQFEPGEFVNGVHSPFFGPGQSAFVIHDGGVAQGRYVFLTLTSPASWVLQNLQVQIQHNSGSPGPGIPIQIAVEASSDPAFGVYATLGILNPSMSPPSSLASAFTFPAGTVYIRLRSITAIPDGSNYIAYGNLSISGALPVSPAGFVEQSFNGASTGALKVGAAVAQPGFVATASTNCAEFEPGEFQNGVVPNFFPLGDAGFIIHNAGTTQGRYVYLGVAAISSWTLQAVTLTVGHNSGSGSGSTFPIQIAIETSTDPSFPSYATFGAIPITVPPGSAFSCSLTGSLSLGSGTTYIRFRSVTDIPDGSNYICYADIALYGSQSAASALLNCTYAGSAEGALRVIAPEIQPGFLGVVGTNCAQFEPGEFVNGVHLNFFAPGQNAFVTHDAGVAQGRYVFLSLTSPAPWVLQNLTVPIQHNSGSPRSGIPIQIAVESSPDPAFGVYTTLGILNPSMSPATSLTGAFPFPAGTVYIRLRSITAIPDGSNYIAYGSLSLSGWLPAPSYSFSPVAGSPFSVPQGAVGVAASTKLVYLFNTQYATVLNARTLQGITDSPFQISTNPQAALLSAAVSPDGSLLYVADFSGEVWVLNAQTLQVVHNLSVPAGPISIAVSPSGSDVYVANRLNNTLLVLSTPSLSQQTVSLGPATGGATSVAVSPDGSLVYVTDSNNSLAVLNAATLQQVANSPITVGTSPVCVAVSPDGFHVYVTNQDGNNLTVLAVGGSSGQNTFTPVTGSPFTVGNSPSSVAVSPNGSLAYVVNQGDNTLSVLSAQTLQPVSPPIALGTRPTAVAVSPDGSLVYVANANDSTLTVIAVVST
jgi:YVTN family beta-propeller protein